MVSTKGKPRGGVILEHGGKKYFFKTKEEADVGRMLHEHADSIATTYATSPAGAFRKEQALKR